MDDCFIVDSGEGSLLRVNPFWFSHKIVAIYITLNFIMHIIMNSKPQPGKYEKEQHESG